MPAMTSTSSMMVTRFLKSPCRRRPLNQEIDTERERNLRACVVQVVPGDRAVVDADDRLPAAVEVGSFDLAARVELRRVAVGVRILLPDLVIVELGVDVAAVPVELGVVADLEAEPRRDRDVAIGVDVDEAAVGREARRHGRVVGRERAGEGEVVVEAPLAAAHVGAAVAPQPRAELGEGGAVHRPLARLGDHVDDAADRLAAVHRAHGAAHDLDAIEVLGQQMREVGSAVRSRGIVDGDAVDQHQHVVGIGAANEDRGLRAGTARLLHRDAGHRLQHFARRPAAGGAASPPGERRCSSR